jgi:hypothetical protein
MSVTQPRYSREEVARRGDEIYEREVCPRLKAEDRGFAAIDVETGAFELGRDERTAIDRLLARKPGAQVWLRKVGSRYTHRFGPTAAS